MSNPQESHAPDTDSSVAEVFERITDAVFALDEEWRFTYLNEGAERVLQGSEAELVGTLVWGELPAAVGSTFRRECERAMETREPVTFEVRYPPTDARYEVRAYPSETGLSVQFRDVTDRTRRQNELEEREQALRRAYEVIADSERSFSQQIDELLDIVSDAVGTDYATLSRVHDDEYVFEAVAAPDDADLRVGDTVPLEATNCERVVATERTLVLDDVEEDAPELAGRAGNAEWGISCYLGTPVAVDSEIYGTFCFYSMEARAEEFSDWQVTFVELLGNWVSYELERQRQNERLESFASMVAHELRNPLHIAKLYHRRSADGDADAAEEVATALDRMEEMIDVLLVTARGSDSTIDREAVELADAAADAWAKVGADEAELVIETDRTVEIDPIHLQHLLENLFKNAVEHGSASGSPSDDDVRQTASDPAHRNPSDSADAVEHGGPSVTVRIGDLADGFYVADDGPGIPEEEHGRVFDAGYTTDVDGIGLGLTFVMQLADIYGWTCTVTESDEGGAQFEFRDVGFVEREAS